MSPPSLLQVQHLSKSFPIGRKRWLQAVSGVSFTIEQGQTLALVGETGCGKSTVAKLIAQLERQDQGQILIEGRNFDSIPARQRQRQLASKVQMIFQNPYTSLDPKMMVFDSLGEGLRVQGLPLAARRKKVQHWLEMVELPRDCASRYPHEFSGGQRQRLCLARALTLEPRLLICDEITSALDVSVQAHIINMLLRLQQESGIGNLFITHNLSLVQYLADQIAVMYLGQIVELAPVLTLFDQPRHHYTAALLAAVPVADPEHARKHPLQPLKGEASDATKPSKGCFFAHRCPAAQEKCRLHPPPLLQGDQGTHQVLCHYPLSSPAQPLAQTAKEKEET